MENRTALVTGSAGYLGSILSKQLKSQGWRVIGFDIKSPSHRYYDVFHQGDICDYDDLYLAFKLEKIDTVFHLAGRIEVGESMKHPTTFWKVNVGGTSNLLDLMKRFKTEKIVFSSTAAVYWASNGPIPEDECIVNNSVYGNTKRACEIMIEDSGLKHVIFRYFNLSGAEGELGENHEPETHLIPNIFKNLNNFTIFGDSYKTEDGTCVRDYVHVCDVADAHISGAEYLESGNRSIILNLGTGKGHSILELINLIEKELGIEVNYHFGKKRSGDPDSLVADVSLAEKVLNYRPKHDILSILKSAYEWYKKDDRTESSRN